jgi:hypothetical protein
MKQGEITSDKIKKESVLTSFMLIIFMVLSPSFINLDQAFAVEKFSIETKIDLEKLNHPDKLKVVATANGDNQTKYLTGVDLDSNTGIVSFKFNQQNNIVTVGSRDEYFVCAYALNPITEQMESYSCIEGNIEHPDGKNKVILGLGAKKTLSTGSFQTVSGGPIDEPTVRVWVPLSDRDDVKSLKVVTMIKGEFETRTINAKELLRQSDDKTLMIPIVYDKISEIGTIQEGDIFFACVSADELNPPEGTECEHRITSHTAHIHNIVAR